MSGSTDPAVIASEELRCPVCDYDLRAQVEPRCPECGYAFVLEELRDPARRLHPYLFEHHPHHNVRSFIQTLLGGWRPKRFWTDLQPTQPSRPRRLVKYMLIVMLAATLPIFGEVVQAYISMLGDLRNMRGLLLRHYSSPSGVVELRRNFPGLTAGQVAARFPVGWTWHQYADAMSTRMHLERIVMLQLPQLMWPVLTLATLMIFRISMRRARVKPIHVMRCVIYSADVLFWNSFALVVGVVAAALLYLQGVTADPSEGSIPIIMAILTLLTLAIFIYRLAAALRLYLRFDHPRSTVFASQAIVFLIVFNFVVAVAWML